MCISSSSNRKIGAKDPMLSADAIVSCCRKKSLAFWKEIDYTIKVNSCRCDGMVDVVDSKSTASDGVPVRVRSPAPKKAERLCALLFLIPVSDSNPFQCQMPVAWGGHQLTKLVASIRFAPKGQIGHRVRSPAPPAQCHFDASPPILHPAGNLRKGNDD